MLTKTLVAIFITFGIAVIAGIIRVFMTKKVITTDPSDLQDMLDAKQAMIRSQIQNKGDKNE